MDEPVISFEISARSEAGCVREDNQDCFLTADLDADAPLSEGAGVVRAVPGSRGPLLVVCDGMGGAAGGDVASKLAAEALWDEMRQAPVTDEPLVYGRLLRRAVRVANRRVWEEGRRVRELRGMGTTLSAAGLAGGVLVLAQVGDSRAYVLRGETLTQVTRDQSIVSALVHSGRITEAEARGSVHANVILQALGVQKDVEVSLSIVELRRDDRLLVCSDGLHGCVGDEVIRQLLRQRPAEAAAALVDRAYAAGAPDNVTVVVADVGGERVPRPASPEDLPRFTELDPAEEGERALTSTSWVARRLAARAGVVDDPGPPVVPATGQHEALRVPATRPPLARAGDLDGPASAALAERSRLSPVAWVVAVVAALGVAALVLSGVL